MPGVVGRGTFREYAPSAQALSFLLYRVFLSWQHPCANTSSCSVFLAMGVGGARRGREFIALQEEASCQRVSNTGGHLF